MKIGAFCFTLLSIIVTIAVSVPAQAQRARVFVSVNGNDANPCTALSPCRTFQAAHDTVADGGEIDVLDTGGYGTLAIQKSISIVNPTGVAASIAAPSGLAAIAIITTNVTVSLRGLTLDGAGTAADGIFFSEGGRVEIVDCVIRNFTHDGIYLTPRAGFIGTKTFIISNTIVSDNGSSGIEVNPGASFSVRGALDHVTAANNGQSGILIDATNATGGFVDIAIADSIAESNGNAGITVTAIGDAKVEIKNSTMSNNVNVGLSVSNAKVGISTNLIALNGAGFSNTNSGTIVSFGDNIIENNRDPNTGTLTSASRQ